MSLLLTHDGSQAAFAAAILSDERAPLSDTFQAETIAVEKSYDGPHPLGEALVDDDEREAALFEPGKLPRDFVLQALERFKDQKVVHKRCVRACIIGVEDIQYSAAFPPASVPSC